MNGAYCVILISFVVVVPHSTTPMLWGKNMLEEHLLNLISWGLT